MDLGRLSSGFHRARWLAELSLAVDGAEASTRRLLLTSAPPHEAQLLLDRIIAARREMSDIRLGGWRAPVQEIGSKWINLSGDGKD